MKFIRVQPVSFNHPSLELCVRHINVNYIVDIVEYDDGTCALSIFGEKNSVQLNDSVWAVRKLIEEAAT